MKSERVTTGEATCDDYPCLVEGMVTGSVFLRTVNDEVCVFSGPGVKPETGLRWRVGEESLRGGRVKRFVGKIVLSNE